MNNIKEINFKNFKWIDITNPQFEQLSVIADTYKLDIFQIKDSLQHGHLPKFERGNSYNFMILRAFVAAENDKSATIGEVTNKIAFFYNENELITIHRAHFDFLEIKETDFKRPTNLMLNIINRIIHTFEEPSIRHSTKIDDVEKTLFLKGFTKISVKELYVQKSQSRVAKKLLQIMNEVIGKLEVDKESATELQDIKDKLINLILINDEVSEDANNLMNSYHSMAATHTNDVMKLLTAYSVFFMPLTFIVGIYGMNFDFMPELRWKYGYAYVLGLMALITLFIAWRFRKSRIL